MLARILVADYQADILSALKRLLRALETGEYERVVSATNADLPTMIRDGRFREGLLSASTRSRSGCRRSPSGARRSWSLQTRSSRGR